MSSRSPDRFVVSSGGCRLIGHSYAPERNAAPGLGVVMVHGLLSSADVFDVDGRERMSLARHLRDEGFHAVSYDQRGAGASTATDWTFGIDTHSLVDLPAVLAVCRERFGFERVVFVSHSLGGTIWIRYVRARLAAASGAAVTPRDSTHQPDIVGGAVLASPAFFTRDYAPWGDIADRGPAFIAASDANHDDVVVREEFVRAQIALYQPGMARVLRPRLLRAILALGGRFTLMAAILRRLPTRPVIYHPDDFDDRTFRHVLGSKTIDRGPARLLVDLYEEIVAGPPDPPPARLPFDGLAIGSALDGFVPLAAVRVFADQFRRARLIVTEDDFGMPSGHIGYLFKAGVQQPTFAAVANYLRGFV
jgi:pimeloyl-ACP methyl ester carboxylesterase